MPKESFTLEVTEDMYKVLNLLMSGYSQLDDDDVAATRLMKTFVSEGIEGIFFDLMRTLAEGGHERNWCKDPNCSDRKHISKEISD